MVIFVCSCKQDAANTIRESYLPDLENGNWRYTKDDNLVKSGRYIDGYKIGLWKYQINNKSENLYWIVHEDSEIKINHPKSWKVTESKDHLFYSIVNRNKEDFFLVNEVNKEDFSVDLDGYFREAVSALKRLDEEKIIDYICANLEYEGRNAYYFRFNTQKGALKASYYILYTEDDSSIYDCTLKINGEGEMLDKEIFAAMVYSLSVNGEKLFENNDELKEWSHIKIEDLD